MVRHIFYHKSSSPSSQQLGIFLSQLVSPVCWIFPRRYQLKPLRLNPYQKNRESWQGTSMNLEILSLLISLFVRPLTDYLLVMAESPQIYSFKVVKSTIIHIWFWFVLRTKSPLEAMILWWESHGLSNGFRKNMWPKSVITMAKMAYLQQTNTVSILMTKGKLRLFRSQFPAS